MLAATCQHIIAVHCHVHINRTPSAVRHLVELSEGVASRGQDVVGYDSLFTTLYMSSVLPRAEADALRVRCERLIGTDALGYVTRETSWGYHDMLCRAYCDAGLLDEAERHLMAYADCGQYSERGEAFWCGKAGVLAMIQGRYDEAQTFLERAAAMCRRQGFEDDEFAGLLEQCDRARKPKRRGKSGSAKASAQSRPKRSKGAGTDPE